MVCVNVKQYLINGFVPSGKQYEFECDNGHRTEVESASRIIRWFVFAAFFLLCFSKSSRADGPLYWVMGGFGAVMALIFLHEVFLRVRAPEMKEPRPL